MSHRLLECDAVRLPPAPELNYAAAEPSEVLDARVQRLAHATLLASRSAARIGPWESALSAALIAGYGVYASAQIFRIVWRAM